MIETAWMGLTYCGKSSSQVAAGIKQSLVLCVGDDVVVGVEIDVGDDVVTVTVIVIVVVGKDDDNDLFL